MKSSLALLSCTFALILIGCHGAHEFDDARDCGVVEADEPTLRARYEDACRAVCRKAMECGASDPTIDCPRQCAEAALERDAACLGSDVRLLECRASTETCDDLEVCEAQLACHAQCRAGG